MKGVRTDGLDELHYRKQVTQIRISPHTLTCFPEAEIIKYFKAKQTNKNESEYCICPGYRELEWTVCSAAAQLTMTLPFVGTGALLLQP